MLAELLEQARFSLTLPTCSTLHAGIGCTGRVVGRSERSTTRHGLHPYARIEPQPCALHQCQTRGVLDIVNVSVTTVIAGHLWWMGQTITSLTSARTNRYVFSIYVVVESVAIFAGANIISLIL